MTLQEIHHRFFSLRNGIIAKALHDGGLPHKRIFGLQLPQLAAIARETGFDETLSETLWQEKDCRESRLLSIYLADPSLISKEKALEKAFDVLSREEADILAWRLLSKTPYAATLPDELQGYIKEALERNLAAS